MTSLFVLDVPENLSVPNVAAEDPAVTVYRIGPYFVISADGTITVDRGPPAAGTRSGTAAWPGSPTR